jgi:outer membrane protein assembly factor BamE
MRPTHVRPRLPVAVALSLLLAAGTAGCVYRPDIQQGNLLKLTDVEQVTVGMSRSQVRYLLGTPMVSDPFAPQRWDYVYRRTYGRDRQVDTAHFIVRFEGDKVSAVEKVALPQPPGPERPASWRFWQKPPVDAADSAVEPPAPPIDPLPAEPPPLNGA